MWWLRYFWLRLMFILTLVNIMTCVGAWYAVSSSYGDRKHHGRHGVPNSFIEISRNFDLLDTLLCNFTKPTSLTSQFFYKEKLER